MKFVKAFPILILMLVFILGCSAAKERDRTFPPPHPTGIPSGAEKKADTPPAPAASGGGGVLPGSPGDKAARAKGEYPVRSESLASKAAGSPRPSVPSASGLKAGFSDDNRQFNYFISFLEKYGNRVKHYEIPVRERIVLKARDVEGRPLGNAEVRIFNGMKLLCSGRSYSDGTFLFFPSEYGKETRYRAVFSASQKKTELDLDRNGLREIAVTLDQKRALAGRIPLDLLFVLDTTGSMGEEIKRLKNTIDIINLNLSSISPGVDIRFGMVLYRDRGDNYVTKIIPFTADLEAFRAELEKVKAEGGGDTPEDLQSALNDAVNKMEWRSGGIRLGFVITDAPPHLDYGQQYTYVHAARDAREKGIKLFTVGTGGLDLQGEYVLRQISQYTAAKYIFLTYGERGESEGGREGSVSHHTGSNYQTDKLESIIIRIAKEEMSWQSDKPLPEGDEYIEAKKIEDEEREQTLSKLFEKGLSQLVDYSSIGIEPSTPATVIPFDSEKLLRVNAEYFTEQFGLSLARNKIFRLVERRDMQKILDELKIQMSGMISDDTAVRAGKLLGAKVLVNGRLYTKGEQYEVFLKLLRVETGEVLSINKLRIDRRLGLRP